MIGRNSSILCFSNLLSIRTCNILQMPKHQSSRTQMTTMHLVILS